jgi:hypothetical protein
MSFVVKVCDLQIVCDSIEATRKLMAACKSEGVEASFATMGWARQRRWRGRCINCSEPAAGGTLRCTRHRARHNFEARARTSAVKRRERAKFLSGLVELHGPTSWTGQQALAAAERESIVLRPLRRSNP